LPHASATNLLSLKPVPLVSGSLGCDYRRHDHLLP
jgi:hypothetical protein